MERKFIQVDVYTDTSKGDADGTIVGYGSVFGNVDSYGDIIAPGAFKHMKNGKPLMLYEHDPTQILGVWDEIEQDAHGLRLKGRIALDTQLGREKHALLKMKALKGLSVGFLTVRSHIQGEHRVLDEIELWEVSLVAWPANSAATVDSVKAIATKDERNEEPGTNSETEDPAAAATTIKQEPQMDIEALKAAIKEALESKATSEAIASLQEKLDVATAALEEMKSRVESVETKTAQRTVTPSIAPSTTQADELRAAFVSYMRNPEGNGLEGKAAFAKDTTSGGAYAVPATLAAGLTAIARNASIVADLVGKRSSTADKYTENLEAADGNYEWVGEADERNITNAPGITTREAAFGEVSALVEVSRQSATDVNFDLMGYVQRSVNRSFTKAIANAILTGNGVKKPKGLFVSGSGITTIDAPVGEADEALGITAGQDFANKLVDALIDLVEGTQVDYRKSFTMSSATRGVVRKLRDHAKK